MPYTAPNTKPTIKFTADLEPVPFKRALTCGKLHFNDSRYSGFKEALGFYAKIAMDAEGQAPFTGRIKILVDVFRNLKPESLKYGDADNHLKAVCDALNGIAFADDRQVISATINLHKGTPPHIDIELEEL